MAKKLVIWLQTWCSYGSTEKAIQILSNNDFYLKIHVYNNSKYLLG